MNNSPQEASIPVCPLCGATDIVCDIQVKKSTEAGWVGLDYKALGPLRGTEPLLADLCLKCGTVCRFHVQNTARKW